MKKLCPLYDEKTVKLDNEKYPTLFRNPGVDNMAEYRKLCIRQILKNSKKKDEFGLRAYIRKEYKSRMKFKVVAKMKNPYYKESYRVSDKDYKYRKEPSICDLLEVYNRKQEEIEVKESGVRQLRFLDKLVKELDEDDE